MATQLHTTDEESSGFDAAQRSLHSAQPRTRRNKNGTSAGDVCICASILCMIGLIIGLMVFVFVIRIRMYEEWSRERAERMRWYREGRQRQVCVTSECLRHAELLRSSLSPNYTQLDPCTDFSAYACDGWRQKHPLPPQTFTISNLDVISSKNTQILQAMLEGHFPNRSANLPRSLGINSENENVQKMRRMYEACMNETRLDKLGTQPLQEMLSAFNNEFPRHGAADTISRAEMTEMLIWLANNGVRPLIDFDLAANATDPEQNVLTIIPPSDFAMLRILQKRNLDIQNPEVQALIDLFSLVAIGNSTQHNSNGRINLHIDHQASRDTLKFLRLIQHAGVPDTPGTGEHVDMLIPARRTIDAVSIDELDKIISPFSVREYFKALAPTNLQPTMIRNGDPAYFTALSELIPSYSRNTMLTFGQLAIIEQWVPYLSPEIARQAVALVSLVTGIDLRDIPDQSQLCVKEVDAAMGLSMGSMFQHYATEHDDILDLRHMADSILDEFSNERLETLAWLDEESRDLARSKVANMRVLLDWSLSARALDELYSDLNVTDDFFETRRYWVEWELKHAFDALSPLVSADKDRIIHRFLDDITAPVVNAFYAPQQNLIAITPGIAQFPVYSDDVPEYITYGRLGFLIGHELTHGFDNRGRYFDKYGAMNDWMKPESAKRLSEKAACFVKQFSEQTISGKNGALEEVNGTLTLGENIADAGGINTAFSAWARRAKDDPLRNQALPGLQHFNEAQLFFLNYANNWCSLNTPEWRSLLLRTDDHSPDGVRINANLQNSRGFKEAFQCKVKEPKCELW